MNKKMFIVLVASLVSMSSFAQLSGGGGGGDIGSSSLQSLSCTLEVQGKEANSVTKSVAIKEGFVKARLADYWCNGELTQTETDKYIVSAVLRAGLNISIAPMRDIIRPNEQAGISYLDVANNQVVTCSCALK